MPKQFGKFIDEKEANEIFSRFQRVKLKYAEKIKEMFKEDPDAMSCFEGNFNMFVFSREQLATLLKRIDKPDDIIAIYPGIKKNDATGKLRQTLICAAYKFSDKKFTLVDDPKIGGKHDVLEHSGGDTLAKIIKIEIIKHIPEDDIQDN